MPTFDTDHHLKTFKEPGEGLRAAKGGKLLPETEAVLKVIARENLVLQTGHLSPEEILLLLKGAKELGVKNMAVTHAMADVPGMSLEQMKATAAMGAYMELDFLNALMGPHAHMNSMQHWQQLTFGDMVTYLWTGDEWPALQQCLKLTTLRSQLRGIKWPPNSQR